MHLRGPLTVSFFVALFLLSVLLTGCGGGGQSGKGSQGGAASKAGQSGGAVHKKKVKAPRAKVGNAPKAKVALGRIGRVDAKDEKFILRPSTKQQGNRIVFKLRKNTKITQNGKTLEQAALKKGQQAQVTYVTVHGRDVARSVALVGGPHAGGKR